MKFVNAVNNSNSYLISCLHHKCQHKNCVCVLIEITFRANTVRIQWRVIIKYSIIMNSLQVFVQRSVPRRLPLRIQLDDMASPRQYSVKQATIWLQARLTTLLVMKRPSLSLS